MRYAADMTAPVGTLLNVSVFFTCWVLVPLILATGSCLLKACRNVWCTFFVFVFYFLKIVLKAYNLLLISVVLHLCVRSYVAVSTAKFAENVNFVLFA